MHKKTIEFYYWILLITMQLVRENRLIRLDEIFWPLPSINLNKFRSFGLRLWLWYKKKRKNLIFDWVSDHNILSLSWIRTTKSLFLSDLLLSHYHEQSKSKTPDCVTECLRIMERDGFPEQGSCLCDSASGKTTDTGGESVRAVIYGDLLCLALCCGLPLGLNRPSSPPPLACYSMSPTTMMLDFWSGKARWVPSLRTKWLFPAQSYCVGG